MAEYRGMNHGVMAALEYGAEDLVIVGDSKLAIQQSLGVIASRQDSLMALLSRHRELVAKLKSVRYLHVVREYNAATGSLAGEALESKVSKVVLNNHRKTELKELNRIQEMIYEPSSDDIKVENASSETFAHILDGKARYIHAMDSDILLQRNTYADVAHQERAEVSATTRSQTKTKKKRVHFEDEVPEGTTNAEATEAVNEDSETQVQRPSAEVRHEPTADDIDPVTLQEERRRRIAKAQDEELRLMPRLVFAINNPHDMTKKETPFYLVHGWDAHTTLRAMTASLKRGVGKQTEALAWRREINHQLQIALEMAKEYQAVEKARRARIHNEKLSRKEQTAIPKGVNDGSSDDDSEPRVKRKVEELAYELGLPDKSGYRFNPVVHVSRLKAVNDFCDRPKARLARDVAKEAIFDFDEEPLPEDSWMPDEFAGEIEVEAILDDRTPMPTSTDRPVREFEVKWVSYESTTWEPASNLSCGGLLYDN
ncbi:hypothetical protein PHMEG_00015731, partial [Phytophthora megakarya]